MSTEHHIPHRGYLASLVSCRCPRCREGKLFCYPLTVRIQRNLEMHDHCPVCHQPSQIEVGFYYGTGYVSYLLALAISAVSLFIWYLIIGFSFKDQRFLFWVITNSFLLIALQPWLMRFSRILWLSFFVSYDPSWPETVPDLPERVNKEQMNNW